MSPINNNARQLAQVGRRAPFTLLKENFIPPSHTHASLLLFVAIDHRRCCLYQHHPSDRPSPVSQESRNRGRARASLRFASTLDSIRDLPHSPRQFILDSHWQRAIIFSTQPHMGNLSLVHHRPVYLPYLIYPRSLIRRLFADCNATHSHCS